MGVAGPAQPVGRGAENHRDAVGRRRRRRAARRADVRCAGDQLHRQPGPAAVHPQPVQDRRRADALRAARGGAHAGDPRAVDLRRPLRRHGLPRHRLRHARRQFAAGGAGFGGDRAGGDAGRAHSGDPFLRRLPHLARGGEDRRGRSRHRARHARRRPHRRAPRTRPVAGASGAARHLAESGRVLPVARARQSLLRRLSADRAGCDGPLRRPHRPALQAVRLRRRGGCRAGDRAHGFRRRDRARDGRASAMPAARKWAC